MFHTSLFFGTISTTSADTPFIITINTDNISTGSSATNQFQLPLVSTGSYSFLVNWGDGSSNVITSYNQAEILHQYSIGGVYTIIIEGTCLGWSFNNNGDCKKMLDLQQWGTGFIMGRDEGGYFYGCSNMTLTAVDVPNLSLTKSLFNCFRDCKLVNNLSISNWDVSNVTNMSGVFRGSTFNQPLNNWNVSNVTDMSSMFRGSTFNQPLDKWNVSNVINMSNIFSGSKFNQPINDWDTSKVTDMSSMFNGITTFNQPLNNWNTANVVNMSGMFNGASSFNQPLNNWDTSKVTDMSIMFQKATSFNQNLNNWNVGSVLNMFSMFNNASSFNQPIDKWNILNVRDMSNMFISATSFNQNLSTWNVASILNMSSMFNNATSFNNDDSDSIQTWSAPLCTSFESMFQGASNFDQPLPNLVKTGNISGCILTSMFQSASKFNQDVGSWDVSKVTNMKSMFQSATAFNNLNSNKIKDWSAPLCTSFESMFQSASNFDQPLTNLVKTGNVSGCILTSMFNNASKFNQDVGNWDVSNVTTFLNMFTSATSFNNLNSDKIKNWSAPLCTSFNGMFSGASNFNKPLTNLVKTSNVSECNLTNMFASASVFNQDIGDWDVSNVIAMTSMFASATAFNNDDSPSIQTWSAPLCTYFNSMFFNASNFNQPLPNLVNTKNVSGCNLNIMFQGANKFNQNIGGWDVSNVTTFLNMFANATAFNNGESPSIQTWSAPLCTSFNAMFSAASNFNQPLTNLVNTSNVSGCTFVSMFQNASKFNQNIGGWDVSNATSMISMFSNATAFNNGESPSIQAWSAPLCTGFNAMFSGASNFNQPLPNLVNTSKVSACNLSSMFQNASKFNQNIGSWDVSKVFASASGMTSMFNGATTFNNGDSPSIQTWSAPLCTYFNSMFQGASNFNQPLTNLVNTSNVSECNLNNMFYSAAKFNQDIGNWNVSKVTAMTNIFYGCTAFNNGENPSIQTWSAPLSTYFNGMFYNASNFNQPLPNLVNTSNVSGCNLSSMFYGASKFNQDVGAWDVSKATYLNSMFNGAKAFNNGESPSIQTWYAPLCKSFTSMFESASNFNQPLSNLVNSSNVSDCTLNDMFKLASKFNQNIGGWDVSKVTNMTSTFSSATAFNNGDSPSIQNWYVPLCISFASMFNNASNFNQPLPILVNTSIVSSCSFSNMFQNASKFNQNIGNWDVRNALSMPFMFNSSTAFNNGDSPSIQAWSAPLCTAFNSMFNNASNFNQPLPNLVNTSNVSECNLSGVFQNASKFNQNVGGWDVSNATSMTSMFNGCTAFNNGESPSIQTWYAPLSKAFNSMFQSASNFNQPLPNLVNTSNVSGCNLTSMFASASKFNQDVGGWDVSKVTDMTSMFNAARAFNNGDNPSIQSWYAPLCTSFNSMFLNASNFNQPLSNLVNTSNVGVCTLPSMFQNASKFNQNISNWDVSKVTDMTSMFNGATAFKQDLSNWTPSSCTTMSSMFSGVDMNNPNSVTNQINYNNLLNSWGTEPKLSQLKNSVAFSAGTSKYTISIAGTARSNLIAKSWTISDGGGV